MIYTFNDCEKNDWTMVPMEEEGVKSFTLNSGNHSLIKITEDHIEEPKEREEVFKLHRSVNNIYKKNTYISYTKLGFVPSVFVSDRLLPVGRCNLICIQVDMSAGEKLINYSYFNFMIFKYKVDKANSNWKKWGNKEKYEFLEELEEHSKKREFIIPTNLKELLNKHKNEE